MKSTIEVVLSNDYLNFLAVLFEPLCNVLRTVPPQTADNSQHKLRSSVMDLLSKMPQSDVFKPRVVPLFDVSLSVLISDNQDNALVATKVLLDLQKAFRGTLQLQAAQLLDHIVKVRRYSVPAQSPRHLNLCYAVMLFVQAADVSVVPDRILRLCLHSR